jgi:hypothetical protein
MIFKNCHKPVWKRMFSTGERIIAAAIILSLILLGPVACGKTPAASKSSGSLNTLQQNKYLTARVYGVMTFDFGGEMVSYPTELKIASVPLQWMGQVFKGDLVVSGPQYSLTDQVHGSVSADGEWLLTLSYSRQIVRPLDSVAYTVSLRNVPIISSANTTEKVRSVEIQGDVQKYIDDINYMAGGAGATLTKYTSMDWANSDQGTQPILKVTFEQNPSDVIGPPGAVPQGGGM